MREIQTLKRVGLVVSIALMSVALSPTPASAAWFTTQLTANDYSDKDPQISGNNVVWSGSDGNDDEIFFYNGSSTVQLTNNGTDDFNHQISGNNVVWSGYENDYEIFFYNGSNTIQLPSDGSNNGRAQVSGNNVVWQGHDGNDWEIFFYNGSSTTQLTNNSYGDIAPQVSGNNVVWEGYEGGNDLEIFFYNGSSTTQLTNNSTSDWDTQISGNNVVWAGYDGNDREIFLYNGSSTTQLTDNGYYEQFPQVSGNNVVWEGQVNNWEIFLYNGSSTTQLTNNGRGNFRPQISGNNVVWDSYNIFFYNGSSTTQLTNNNHNDELPQVSGNNVVWYSSDGEDDEIFMAGLDTIAPSDPVATSSSHIVGTWSNDNTVNVGFTGASDNQSGVDGFSYDWHQSPTHLPDKIKDVEETKTSVTSRPLANGTWYFHLRTVDNAGNWSSTVHLGPFKIDANKPMVSLRAPFTSTRVSKTTTFKVIWSAADLSPSSGMQSVRVYYRPSGSSKWRLWKTATGSGEANFTGKAGTTYSFRALTIDNARNWKWSKTYKTIVPFNEGMSLLRRIGFNGYRKLGKSQNYLSSVRYSYRAGHALVYKLYNTDGIGLVVTKGPKMGRAQIYIDGKYVTTVDAHKSSTKARQLIYYKGFAKKGTHFLKVVNLGTAGRAKFEVDGVVVKR